MKLYTYAYQVVFNFIKVLSINMASKFDFALLYVLFQWKYICSYIV